MSNTQAALLEALPEKDIRDIANGLNGLPHKLGQWQRDLLVARAVEAKVRAAIAQAAPKTLTDEQIDRIAENCAKAMPDGIQGFQKLWGWRQFARELLDVCAGHQRAQGDVAPQGEPVAWRQHVEQRLRTWRQSTMNRSGDRLALDDFMGDDSIEDLLDFVCDEWAAPQPAEAAPKQEAVAERESVAGSLLRRFESSVSQVARLHQEYMGKAMTDDAYNRFASARDETIPALRRELLAMLAPAQPAKAAPKQDEAPKLIGWRTADYLRETADPKMAANWAPHETLLPIFEGDPNTMLAAAPHQPAPEPVGRVLRNGKRADGQPWMGAWFKQDGTADLPDGAPLFAAPQARATLGDTEAAK